MLDQRSYDLQGRLTRQTLSQPDATIIDTRSYRYDANSNIIDRTSTPQTNRYQYDPLDRLVDDNHNSNNGIDEILYRYDANYNRVLREQDNRSQQYLYNPDSN